MVIGVLVISFLSLFPQKIPSVGIRLYCVVHFYMENRDRYCYADNLYAECGDECWGFYPIFCHSPPWGNWGVVSNVRNKYDGNQFQGWYWDDGWYQWNSCTNKYHNWGPPNCDYYNAANCWEQETDSNKEINEYAQSYRWVEIPRFAWDDGWADLDGEVFVVSGNFLEAWELDWPGEDDKIERMTFPNCSVTLTCDYYGCDSVTSPWKNPTGWDRNHRLDAKIRLKVTGSELIWEYPWE